MLIIVLSVKSCNKTESNNDNDNTTVTTHTHTYATTWSSDATNHWYADTCGHNTKKGEAAHTWGDGVETESGTKYTCTVCGYEKTGASRNQVNAAKWNEIFTNVSNCTINTVSSNSEQNVYYTENGLMNEDVTNGSKTLYAVDDGKYYQYILGINATEWTKTEITEEQYNMWSTTTLVNIFVDKYSEFTYDTKSKSYTLASLDIDGYTNYQNIKISFEDNKVTRVKYIIISGTSTTIQVEIKDFGSTEITIPTNIHTHTYSSAWTYDETSHWHQATCGHDFKKDEDLHTIVDGECTVCGYLVPTDGIIYTNITDDTCEVYGFPSSTSASGKIVIASTYNGMTVTQIGYRAFAWQEGITSVVIPSSVTKISTQAFMACTNLEEIVLSEGLEYIGEEAFMSCTKVSSIVIPKSIKTICANIFSSSSNLTKVYYAGTAEEFAQIGLYSSNYQFLTVATRYYYSETEPTDTTNKYWHYVNGVVTEW